MATGNANIWLWWDQDSLLPMTGAAAWWLPALILAFGYLYIIQRDYSGKVNGSKDNRASTNRMHTIGNLSRCHS
jgi:hypothetical protein